MAEPKKTEKPKKKEDPMMISLKEYVEKLEGKYLEKLKEIHDLKKNIGDLVQQIHVESVQKEVNRKEMVEMAIELREEKSNHGNTKWKLRAMEGEKNAIRGKLQFSKGLLESTELEVSVWEIEYDGLYNKYCDLQDLYDNKQDEINTLRKDIKDLTKSRNEYLLKFDAAVHKMDKMRLLLNEFGMFDIGDGSFQPIDDDYEYHGDGDGDDQFNEEIETGRDYGSDSGDVDDGNHIKIEENDTLDVEMKVDLDEDTGKRGKKRKLNEI